jgi:NADPH2:quinone reductase
MHKNQSVIGYWLTARIARDPVPAGRAVAEMLALAAAGKLHGVVRHVFPLEAAADAHRAIGDRRTSGKVVLTV